MTHHIHIENEFNQITTTLFHFQPTCRQPTLPCLKEERVCSGEILDLKMDERNNICSGCYCVIVQVAVWSSKQIAARHPAGGKFGGAAQSQLSILKSLMGELQITD